MIEHGVASCDGHDPDRKSFYVTMPDLDVQTPTSFFAVYNGSEASGKFCTTNIHQELHKHGEFDTNLRQALEDILYRIDRQMKVASTVYGSEHTDDPSVDKHSGSLPVKEIPFCGGISASIALIRGADSIIATIGSTLCFISKDGKPNRLGTGSIPEDNLKMKNCDSAENFPDILTESMEDADFIMMASGSVLDLMPVKQLTDFVTERTKLRVNLDTICNDLICHYASKMADKVPSNTCILILRSKDREGDAQQQIDDDAPVSTEKEQDDTEKDLRMDLGKSLYMLQKLMYARVLRLRDEATEIVELSSAAAPTDSDQKIKIKIGSIRILLQLGVSVAETMKELGLSPLQEGKILRSPIKGFSIEDADICSSVSWAKDTLLLTIEELLLAAVHLVADTCCLIDDDFSEASYLSCQEKLDSAEIIFAILRAKGKLCEEAPCWEAKMHPPLFNLQKNIYAQVRRLRDEATEIAELSSAAAPTDSDQKIKIKIGSIRILLQLGVSVAETMKELGLSPLQEGKILRSPIKGFSIDGVTDI